MDRTEPDGATGDLRTSTAEETLELGRRLGAAAMPGTLLALIGPLGAGKTQLAKGVAEGLGVTGVVNSPTFIIMNEHAGRLRLFHIDAYRLDEDADPVAAGLMDDRQASGVAVVEWAGRLAGWLPSDRLEIELQPLPSDPSARAIRFRAFGEAHAALARRCLAGAGAATGSAR